MLIVCLVSFVDIFCCCVVFCVVVLGYLMWLLWLLMLKVVFRRRFRF